MVTSRIGLPTLTALGALIAAWLVTMDINAGPLRAVLVLGFLIIGPGAAFVPLLRLSNPAYVVVLSVALSLTLDLLVGALAVYGGFWSPELIINILVGITFAGVLWQVLGNDNMNDDTPHDTADEAVPPSE